MLALRAFVMRLAGDSASVTRVADPGMGLWLLPAFLFFFALSMAVAFTSLASADDCPKREALDGPAVDPSAKDALPERDASLLGYPMPVGEPLNADTAFCPELMVPHDCECVLVIPVGTNLDFPISDASGNVVLCARAGAASPVGAEPRDMPLVALTLTSVDGRPLALVCSLGDASGAFHLLRSDGACFAGLVFVETGRYQLTVLRSAGAPLTMNFWGSFADHAVNVTEVGRGLLATTELCHVDFDPVGEYYRLRVAPATDVALVLCGLLAVDRLAASGGRRCVL